ncbi:cadherin-like and PC-esterase domain-containing protein 1 [Watersipora subatra]|uniref:cadherin-like and PC-esterase domain-containing protein 1 n=1 Tax=Watersipora subatra TaxID=2589382 RepID=UPI00355B9B18
MSLVTTTESQQFKANTTAVLAVMAHDILSVNWYDDAIFSQTRSSSLFGIVSLLLSSSSDFPFLEIENKANPHGLFILSQNISGGSGGASAGELRKITESMSRSPRSHSENASNMLRFQLNSKFKTVQLPGQGPLVISIPFEFYQATISVLPSDHVSSVTMNKIETREMNYSLGLGENFLDVGLHFKPSQENASSIHKHHTISLIRQLRALKIRKGQHHACYLEQDCDLIVYNNRRCGVQPMSRWTATNYTQGYWQLNCTKCTREETCNWEEAHWVELSHQENPKKKAAAPALQTSLKNYQLLFVGDSTNRGIMQSLMERVNGSLYHAIKSHGFIRYDNVGLANNFSFTYYPIFWKKEQPTFAESLHSIASNCGTKGKEERTILVIGGVQWLTEMQITELNNFIKGRGIPPGNVYIKTHGSGFHVNTSYTTIHHSKESLRKLYARNEALKRRAQGYGFRVIDTLQVTQSRYKEFHQGACACHFHKVIRQHAERDNSKRSSIYTALQTRGLTEESSSPLYHIAGPIHNAYSDILIRDMSLQLSKRLYFS